MPTLPHNLYDALILGGGPAGLSAAVYLGRFNRSVLVLDAGGGRSSFLQTNDNYLGFPEGVTTRDLRDRGRQQAERFGAHFRMARVARVETVTGTADTPTYFRAVTDSGDFTGRTLLFATGVTDIWPDIPGITDWVGLQVFWCITCDGFRSVGKRLVCIGNDDEAAVTALQLLRFTDQITLVTEPKLTRFSPEIRRDLKAQGIAVHESRPVSLDIIAETKAIAGVCLEDGTQLPCDLIFSLLGVRPNTALAGEMGLTVDNDGYILIDEEGYTSVPGVFAAGDLTGIYTQQVASAVHSGAEAAQTMNYYLYALFQKNPWDRRRPPRRLRLPAQPEGANQP